MGLSGVASVGIALGSLVFFVSGVAAVFLWYRRRKRRSSSSPVNLTRGRRFGQEQTRAAEEGQRAVRGTSMSTSSFTLSYPGRIMVERNRSVSRVRSWSRSPGSVSGGEEEDVDEDEQEVVGVAAPLRVRRVTITRAGPKSAHVGGAGSGAGSSRRSRSPPLSGASVSERAADQADEDPFNDPANVVRDVDA